jgi:tRNA pseudouridine38-40 synthase
MRVALKIAYDGRNFYGFARQPKIKTIEGEILNLLTESNIIDNVRKAEYQAASRTDRGVSALCNVIAFNTKAEPRQIVETFNKKLQIESIYAYEIANVSKDFNPRFAKMRQYRYYIFRNNNLDVDLMMKTASMFTGLHDFSNFAKIEKNKNPVRKIDNILFIFRDNIIAIDFFAQTFLWQQIRRIVSAISKVATGKLSLESVANALSNPNVKADFGVAPPEYLILKDIAYEFKFRRCGENKFLINLEKSIISSLK